VTTMDKTDWFKIIGGALAFAFGVSLLYVPPAQLAGQAATIGAGFTFVTAGLGAFGLTINGIARAARATPRK
jgi:hypothetical protein